MNYCGGFPAFSPLSIAMGPLPGGFWAAHGVPSATCGYHKLTRLGMQHPHSSIFSHK